MPLSAVDAETSNRARVPRQIPALVQRLMCARPYNQIKTKQNRATPINIWGQDLLSKETLGGEGVCGPQHHSLGTSVFEIGSYAGEKGKAVESVNLL